MIKSVQLKSNFLIIFLTISIIGTGQVNEFKKDSLSSNDYHYRVDVGFSLLHFISTSFNPKYHQHLYVGVSKNNPKWKFVPGVNFLFSNSSILKDSVYYGRKFIIRDYYIALSFIRNNFPRKEKFNLYYGFSLGGYYTKEVRPSFIEVVEKKSFGFNLVPLIGIDIRVSSTLRLFTELQLGLISQKEKSIELFNGNVISSYSSKTKYFLFAFIPIKFGVSFIIK